MVDTKNASKNIKEERSQASQPFDFNNHAEIF